ncbi:transmembrane protein PMIS2 [Marmota marmota marmota]|uniref:transmembrane protein PMIS2 n=1 Tax=Marmota marmota marmota TaxID=9994 RepID=UPI002092727A|nr:transmembrane protein PMIS2 [Marmota marmota marmota]
MVPKPKPPPPPAENAKPQSPEELAFYAPNHLCLVVLGILLCPPLGILAFKERKKSFLVQKLTTMLSPLQIMLANHNSEWEQAYKSSRKTGWLSVFSILGGLAIIYLLFLYI